MNTANFLNIFLVMYCHENIFHFNHIDREVSECATFGIENVIRNERKYTRILI